MKPRTGAALALPAWARALLAAVPLRDSREEVEADFAELFVDREARYGRWYAHRRLAADIMSVWRGTPRGGRVFHDLRFGLRLFGKHPLPVGLAIGGLALAIGVVTAVFSLVNATMLRPFAMDDPASVIQVTRPGHDARWPYSRFLAMRSSKTVPSIEASMADRARVSTTAGAAGAERRLLFVSGGYLQSLGGRPAMGRSLTAEDDLPGATPVVVISHAFWRAEYQSDPTKIGATVWINGAPATIVGVLEPEFTGTVVPRPSMWIPFAAFDDLLTVAATYTINGRTPSSLAGEPFGPASRTLVDVIGRLAPGVPAAAAESELGAIVTRAAASAPGADPHAAPAQVRVFGAATPIDGPAATESYMEIASVLTLVGLVLAVACANTANLLLAAAATRTREIGVRVALGATPGRLLAQVTGESVMLSLAAGGAGFVLAWWLSPLLGVMVKLDGDVGLTPDWRVFAFVITVSTICGLGAGVAPARVAARGGLLAALQSHGGVGRTAVPSRLRTSFVGFQAAVSMLLLVAAALLARTVIQLTRTDPGFDVDRVVTVEVTTPQKGFDEAAYLNRAVELVRALPSVERLGQIERRPFGFTREVVWHAGISGQEGYTLFMSRTDAGYFPAVGIRLRRGRFFTESERAAMAPVAVVSESVANRFFSTGDPIGQSLSMLPDGDRGLSESDRSATIIGVVADAMLNRVFTEAFGTIYRPMRVALTPKERESLSPPTLVIRSSQPGAAARAVEDSLRRLDSRVRPATWIVGHQIEAMLGDQRMLAWLAGPLAGLALVLAVLGIYGVTAFVTGRRTQETSVRLAMGASAGDVLKLLIKDAMRPVLIGLGIGLVAAIGAARIFASVFPGISPNDPLAVGGAAISMLGASLIAVLLPARRAARVDPATILRES